jgi:hypothetical protein
MMAAWAGPKWPTLALPKTGFALAAKCFSPMA